jgi:hypothetical protein
MANQTGIEPDIYPYRTWVRSRSVTDYRGNLRRQFLYSAPKAVSKLAALTQALVTLSSASSPEQPEHLIM